MFTGIVERKVVSDTIMGGIGVIRVAQMYKRLNFCLSHSSRLPSITSVFVSGCITGVHWLFLVITMTSIHSSDEFKLLVRSVPKRPKVLIGCLVDRNIRAPRLCTDRVRFKDDPQHPVSQEDNCLDTQPTLLLSGSKETTTPFDDPQSVEGCIDVPCKFFESKSNSC